MHKINLKFYTETVKVTFLSASIYKFNLNQRSFIFEKYWSRYCTISLAQHDFMAWRCTHKWISANENYWVILFDEKW